MNLINYHYLKLDINFVVKCNRAGVLNFFISNLLLNFKTNELVLVYIQCYWFEYNFFFVGKHFALVVQPLQVRNTANIRSQLKCFMLTGTSWN